MVAMAGTCPSWGSQATSMRPALFGFERPAYGIVPGRGLGAAPPAPADEVAELFAQAVPRLEPALAAGFERQRQARTLRPQPHVVDSCARALAIAAPTVVGDAEPRGRLALRPGAAVPPRSRGG